MHDSQKLTAESAFTRIMKILQSLDPQVRDKCCQMICTELWNTFKGDEALELELVTTSLVEKVHTERHRANLEQQKNSRRSRPKDKIRSEKICADRAAKMSLGKIAQKHKISIEAVKGVLRREKKSGGNIPGRNRNALVVTETTTDA
jgi:hypothetical protein